MNWVQGFQKVANAIARRTSLTPSQRSSSEDDTKVTSRSNKPVNICLFVIIIINTCGYLTTFTTTRTNTATSTTTITITHTTTATTTATSTSAISTTPTNNPPPIPTTNTTAADIFYYYYY